MGLSGRDRKTILYGVTAAIIILATISALIWGVRSLEDYRCRTTAELMGMEYRYSVVTNCMIKHKGRFIPLTSYREIP